MTDDRFDLQRFIDAQDGVYAQALGELRRGRKTSHWMWFVFPQLRGLGQSSTAVHYGITSLVEARAYLEHHTLGPRLHECTAAVNAVSDRSLHDIFGSPDDMKFHSSMTLFQLADPNAPDFTTALDKYCDGEPDAATVRLLGD
ncbi:MAG TPA: DUF1810 domain-containing protein [Acidimicrobiia bacterium]|jgi:uncharacterized protein (DUF1810 family)